MNTHILAVFTSGVMGLFGGAGLLDCLENKHDDHWFRVCVSALFTCIAISWWIYG